MHSPSPQARLPILEESQRINLYLDRIKDKLDRRCMNNLSETEYKAEFDQHSEFATLIKPDK